MENGEQCRESGSHSLDMLPLGVACVPLRANLLDNKKFTGRLSFLIVLYRFLLNHYLAVLGPNPGPIKILLKAFGEGASSRWGNRVEFYAKGRIEFRRLRFNFA